MSELTPREIVAELDKYIIGQNQAKRMVAIAVRNRWRRQRLAAELRNEVAPRNIIMMGPTGVGKTEIARRLAKLCSAPFIKVEATKYTEVGYVGRDVESMVRDLAEEAVRLVKKQESGRHGKDAEEAAVQKIAEIMWPAKKKETRSPMEIILGEKAEKTGVSDEGERERRKDLLARIRSGELDDRQIEVELEEKGNIEDTADNEQANRISQIFASMMPKKMKKRKMTVRMAKTVLAEVSAEEMVDMDVVRDRAVALAEERGIIFIDEIDAIGKKRDGQMGGNDEREQTLNQLLTEMDGFEGNNGVIILAATNRPESLDPALTRPGRFDRRVPVELPDLAGREAILKVHAKKIKASDDVDLHTIARMASGASGAELANIINEAALRAVRSGRTVVNESDLEESIEVVIAGYQKKNAVLSDQEKKVVAYHEIGHALVAALQSHSAPVQKITIIPRTSGALGYTMQVEQGDKYLMTKKELENKIATFTGGRAAEEIIFGEITTGASNDIEQATKIARAMITRYGMTDEFDMVAMENVTNQYLGGDTSLSCSADTQKEIDEKVVQLVKAEHEKARKILAENREKLDELAMYLYEKETITGDKFMDILDRK